MGFKIFYFMLCFHLASTANRSGQNHAGLKSLIQKMFQRQETTLNEQQQKIEEYQQQLRNFSQSQEMLIYSWESIFANLDGINEFLFQTCDESREVLVEKIRRMNVKFSLQKEMINNLTKLLEIQMDENIRYHENKRNESSNHQQSILESLHSVEECKRKEEEGAQNQTNNTYFTTPGNEDHLSTVNPKLSTMTIHQESCDEGWEYWEYFNGSCYYFSNFITNWNQASIECRLRNAHLAIITSVYEDEHLFALRKKNLMSTSDGYWLDGTDALLEGNWIWHTTGEAVTYTDWGAGEPNNNYNKEDCLQSKNDLVLPGMMLIVLMGKISLFVKRKYNYI